MIEPNISSEAMAGLYGMVDYVGPEGVRGWVLDAADLSKEFILVLLVNEHVIGTAKADVPRQDISEILNAPVKCGFSISWNKAKTLDAIRGLPEAAECSISIYTKEHYRALLIRNLPTVSEVVRWMGHETVEGHFDEVDSKLLAIGWAYKSTTEMPAEVEILVDGIAAAKGKAVFPRPDIISDKHTRLMSGFRIQIPSKAITRLKAEVEARVDGILLPNSPMVIDLLDRIAIGIPGIENNEVIVRVNGWPGDSLQGELYLDGEKITTLCLAAALGNAGAKGHLEGRWKLPEQWRDGQPHVYVFSIGHENAIVRSDVHILSYPKYSVNIRHYRKPFYTPHT